MKMKAALLTGFREPYSIEDVELLPLAPTRVLVRTHASPFCRTDVASWSGILGKIPPTILGHSSAGEIIAAGEDVRHLAAGQRVIVHGTPECGRCYYCSIDRPDQCAELFNLGGIFPDIARRENGDLVSCAGCVGGYAEVMSISMNQVYPVETDLSSETLSLFGCGVSTGYGAVVCGAQLAAGESVAIFGAGQIGLWALQSAKLVRPSVTIVVEPLIERRAVAERLGADIVLDPSAGDVREQILELTGGRGADVTIEAAGEPEAQRAAIVSSRRAGRVVLSGLQASAAQVTLPQVPFAVQSRTIVSVQNGNLHPRRDFPRIIGLLESGALDPTEIITTRYRLDQLDDAMAASADNRDLTGLVVFD